MTKHPLLRASATTFGSLLGYFLGGTIGTGKARIPLMLIGGLIGTAIGEELIMAKDLNKHHEAPQTK